MSENQKPKAVHADKDRNDARKFLSLIFVNRDERATRKIVRVFDKIWHLAETAAFSLLNRELLNTKIIAICVQLRFA